MSEAPDARSREELLLQGLDLAQTTGAEIGPLARPLVSKEHARVIYVDHSDAATLRQRYAGHADVEVSRIEVDVIWGAKTLRQAIRHANALPPDGLDYVIASHVVEHVPDFVGWLREVRQVLRADGRLRLAVPDRRYTFDRLRRESSLTEVLAAWVQQDRRPNVHSLLDFCLNETRLSAEDAWAGRFDEDALRQLRPHTLQSALLVARDALYNGGYHDVHCWTFTPRSFALLAAELAHHGLIDFECEFFHDTRRNANEFIVGLRPGEDAAQSEASWRAMAEAVAG